MVIFHGYVSHNQRVYTNPDGNTSAQCNHGRIKGSTSNAPPLRARLPGWTLLFLWLVLPNSNMFHIVSHNWWENVQETHIYIYIHTLKNMVSGEDCSLNIHWECSNPSPQSHLSAECCSTGSGGKPPRRNRQRVHTYSICTHTIADTNVYIYVYYI